MTKALACALLLILNAGDYSLAQSSSQGTLEIEFIGIQNCGGQIAIGLNTSEEGWPRKAEVELQFSKNEAKRDSTYIVVIQDMAYGTCAISVLDDENSNFKMEMFMRIPKEGWGFSMNPPFRLFAPKFEECAFEIKEPFKKITIHMHYVGKDK